MSQAQTIYTLYHDCVLAGVAPAFFWDLSLDEVDLFLKRKQIDKKERLMEMQALANLIINGVAVILGGDKNAKLLDMTKLYPQLFEEDKLLAEEEEKKRQVELNKANMIAFMNRFNSRKKGAK